MFAPLTLTAILATSPQTAPADKGRAAIELGLKATGLNFGTSTSGKSFTVTFDHESNQKQVVYVATEGSALSGMQSHIIYSQCWSNGGLAPSEKVLKLALSKSKKLGQFYVYKDTSDKYAIRFGVHFDSNLLPVKPTSGEPTVMTLKDLIYFVDAVAFETATEMKGMQ